MHRTASPWPRWRHLMLALLAAGTWTAPVAARSNGVVGVSGIDGSDCNSCHVPDPGSVAPQVRFEGPTQVDPSSETTYRFVVTSAAPQTQVQAGFNVAAGGGELVVVDGQREKLQTDRISGRGELTHTGPKDIDQAGEASWEFHWRAPAAAGVYGLWGAGNAVDASGSNAGDANAATMLTVTVGEVAPTPSPMPTVTPGPACAGDCNGDGTVAVNELISGVNIALGSAAVTVCAACDANDDGSVSVNELVAAVAKALNGC